MLTNVSLEDIDLKRYLTTCKSRLRGLFVIHRFIRFSYATEDLFPDLEPELELAELELVSRDLIIDSNFLTWSLISSRSLPVAPKSRASRNFFLSWLRRCINCSVGKDSSFVFIANNTVGRITA